MKPDRGARAFTVIEMLAGLTVLGIILLLMGQMTGLVNRAYGEGLGRVDNFTKSRAVLDLLASDLRHAVLRPDLPAFQVGGAYTPGSGYAAGTATNAFYTLLPSITAAASPRGLSLVSYTVDAAGGPDKIALWRADDAASWSDNASQVFQGSLAGPLANLQRREMAPGVVGFQFLFRRQDGTVLAAYPGYSAANPVVSVGVALAVIGNKALDHLTTTPIDQVGAIQSALAIPATASIASAKAYWDGTVLTAGFFAGYPKDLGSNLRTFERWIDCPAF